MADPRFYENRGPFTLADVCANIGMMVDDRWAGERHIDDVASLQGAGRQHLSLFALSGPDAAERFQLSKAGFCLVAADKLPQEAPKGMTLLPVREVQRCFALAIGLFYPQHAVTFWPQKAPIDPSARLGENVVLGMNTVVGPGAEIGDGTRIGSNTVIGKGVAIGRRCEIASNVTVTHSYIGDDVLILPGASIGQPGFGFASSREGHIKIPQIGRVIVQDRVEIGAGTTIDRGALGDTVIGEGSKLDNLVQIGHNTHIGRHCMIVAQVGISGSCEIGDYVVMGGQAGIADHVRTGPGVRFAARAGVVPGDYPKGDWAGTPAVPGLEWRKQAVALSRLVRRRKRDNDV